MPGEFAHNSVSYIAQVGFIGCVTELPSGAANTAKEQRGEFAKKSTPGLLPYLKPSSKPNDSQV